MKIIYWLVHVIKEIWIKLCLAIKYGADNFDRGLLNACDGGHKEIVELMVRNGASSLKEGLLYAHCKGYKEIVYLLLSKGSDCYRELLDKIDFEYWIKRNNLLNNRDCSKYHPKITMIIQAFLRSLDYISNHLEQKLPMDLVYICTEY